MSCSLRVHDRDRSMSERVTIVDEENETKQVKTKMKPKRVKNYVCRQNFIGQ